MINHLKNVAKKLFCLHILLLFLFTTACVSKLDDGIIQVKVTDQAIINQLKTYQALVIDKINAIILENLKGKEIQVFQIKDNKYISKRIPQEAKLTTNSKSKILIRDFTGSDRFFCNSSGSEKFTVQNPPHITLVYLSNSKLTSNTSESILLLNQIQEKLKTISNSHEPVHSLKINQGKAALFGKDHDTHIVLTINHEASNISALVETIKKELKQIYPEQSLNKFPFNPHITLCSLINPRNSFTQEKIKDESGKEIKNFWKTVIIPQINKVLATMENFKEMTVQAISSFSLSSHTQNKPALIKSI